MGAENDLLLAGHRRLLDSDYGGTIEYGNGQFPAAIGDFTLQQVLRADGGGFSPKLIGLATVALEDLPDSIVFKSGEKIIANPNLPRPRRECHIVEHKDLGALIELTLHDVNQGA